MLQRIPALPQSIQFFHVWRCQSLHTVLSSMTEPSKTPECLFLLLNCIKLDEHSFDAILKDAIVRIEFGVQNEDDATMDINDYAYYSDESTKVRYILPARSEKVQDWFHCSFTQALVTIELPLNFLGFIFYLVVSQVPSCQIGCRESIGCDCYLETSQNERINITSFFLDESSTFIDPPPPYEFKADHIFLWYDEQCCKQIMEAIKESNVVNDNNSTQNYPKLRLKFFAATKDYKEAVTIKECGFHWIYSLEEGEFKPKRTREVHEVEANVVQDVKGAESNEQDKLKQGFRTSNLEEETEDSRYLLEELLHIGFGGDLM